MDKLRCVEQRLSELERYAIIPRGVRLASSSSLGCSRAVATERKQGGAAPVLQHVDGHAPHSTDPLEAPQEQRKGGARRADEPANALDAAEQDSEGPCGQWSCVGQEHVAPVEAAQQEQEEKQEEEQQEQQEEQEQEEEEGDEPPTDEPVVNGEDAPDQHQDSDPAEANEDEGLGAENEEQTGKTSPDEEKDTEYYENQTTLGNANANRPRANSADAARPMPARPMPAQAVTAARDDSELGGMR